jgi:hypothetical protein
MSAIKKHQMTLLKLMLELPLSEFESPNCHNFFEGVIAPLVGPHPW